MRDGRLQGIQTIVEGSNVCRRECDDDCLFLDRQNCGTAAFSGRVGDRSPTNDSHLRTVAG